MDGGVGHPHHVLCDTRQLEVVVVSADVEERQVDGVDVRPVNIGLEEERETQTGRARLFSYMKDILYSTYLTAHTIILLLFQFLIT